MASDPAAWVRGKSSRITAIEIAFALHEARKRAAKELRSPVDDPRMHREKIFVQQIQGLWNVEFRSAPKIGVSGQPAGNVDYASWAHILDVNTMGPLRVLEAFIDHIARSERKLVVTITSGMGSIGDNTSGGLDCLSHLEGCGKHGDAKRGD